MHSWHFPELSKHFIQFLSHEIIAGIIFESSPSIKPISVVSDDNIILEFNSGVSGFAISWG